MLSFISNLDDFISRLFARLGEEFTIGTLGVLITGIIMGFLICSSIYGVLLAISIKHNKPTEVDLSKNSKIDIDKMHTMVDDIKERFIIETEGSTVKERFGILGNTIMETLNSVAGEYYPDSKYPLYELTIEELIMFLHYLSTRIDDVFNKPLLRPFKRMSISQIFKLLDYKKKIDDNKLVKAANRAQMGKISKFFFTAINYANPVYWVKKLVTGTTINFALRKVCLVIIDIVAEETNKTYSKLIFSKEQSLRSNEIDTILKLLEEGEFSNE